MSRGRCQRAVGARLTFVGLACLRFAAIAAHNLRLHRDGKRVDAFYEELAPSIPHLLDCADRTVAVTG
jgi:hypothetical protein